MRTDYLCTQYWWSGQLWLTIKREHLIRERSQLTNKYTFASSLALSPVCLSCPTIFYIPRILLRLFPSSYFIFSENILSEVYGFLTTHHTLSLSLSLYIYIYIYIYTRVCVYMYWERGRNCLSFINLLITKEFHVEVLSFSLNFII